MANTLYKIYPEPFEALREDRTTETGAQLSRSTRPHSLCPPFPQTEGVSIDLVTPDRLVIKTDDLTTFTWDLVQLPIVFATKLDHIRQPKLYEQYVRLREIATGKEFSFLADVQAHDLKTPSAPLVCPENAFRGTTFTYNIFYFFAQLPLHSATYDLQVRIADVVSNTRRIDIQLYENDTLIMPAGKELP